MILYHIASVIKIILGLAILLITYTSISFKEDPAIGIGLGFVGLFIVVWGVSFYIFRGLQKIFRAHMYADRIMKDSYKLSLLFGMYIVINVAILIQGSWNKWRGILLLAGFIGLQMFLFQQPTAHGKK